jgi:hypothetical protein
MKRTHPSPVPKGTYATALSSAAVLLKAGNYAATVSR